MNPYKEETRKLCQMNGWDQAPVSTVWLLFTEEIGELASAIRHRHRQFTTARNRKTQDVTMEMGDVFSYLFQLAYMLDVDLDEMWRAHNDKMKTRNYFTSRV
jgi:NTP pyrophosphatase (non-canonical NTP hydrolase)